MLARHVSDLIGPHQERFVQAVFADLACGTTVRTTRHVQPLLRVYSALMLARHVSDLIGPSSGAFFTSCIPH